jgi:hypothetical protein
MLLPLNGVEHSMTKVIFWEITAGVKEVLAFAERNC